MSGEKKFIVAIVLGSSVLFVLLLLAADRQNKKLSAPLAGEMQPSQGAAHVPRGTLVNAQDPPTSGDHYGDGVAGPGIHDEPVADGLTVHSMEHGAVVLHFDPNQLSEEEIKDLRNFFGSELSGKKIMLPRENMSKPIILTSWEQLLALDAFDSEQIVAFFETNNDRGPEKVPTY